jgi:hypothetical protein
MSHQNVQITPRDIELLKLINGFGFVDVRYVCDQFCMHNKIAYRRLRKLVLKQLLVYEKLFYQAPGVYRLTKAGVDITDDVVPPLKKLVNATYKHNLLIAYLSVVLEKKFNGQFLTERHLRHQLGLTGVGQASHVPDGVLTIEGKQYAIEVELTTKGSRRLESIIGQYRKDFKYDEVWYFCANNEVKNKLKSAIGSSEFIKLYDLKDYLQSL